MSPRFLIRTSILIIGLILCLLLRSLRQQPYEITNLGTLGGNNSDPYALNDKGQVVGCAQTADGSTHAFLWEQGRMIDLFPLPGQSGSACALNNCGQVAGIRGISTHQEHAFLWQAGKLQDLGTLGGRRSGVSAINDRGQTVGWSELPKRKVRRVFGTIPQDGRPLCAVDRGSGFFMGWHTSFLRRHAVCMAARICWSRVRPAGSTPSNATA